GQFEQSQHLEDRRRDRVQDQLPPGALELLVGRQQPAHAAGVHVRRLVQAEQGAAPEDVRPEDFLEGVLAGDELELGDLALAFEASDLVGVRKQRQPHGETSAARGLRRERVKAVRDGSALPYPFGGRSPSTIRGFLSDGGYPRVAQPVTAERRDDRGFGTNRQRLDDVDWVR